jgi:RimK family alpha-L-glutamate ligase
MKFAVVAHRRSATNNALVSAARAWGLDAVLVEPRRALSLLEPGDLALARLDVREGLDGIERGTGELERLAAGGVDVRNPPGTLVVAHDKLLTARTLRLAGLPHPHTTLLSPALPAAVPELPLVLKPRFGSWGRDVERCSTAEELDAALVRLQRKHWFREHGALVQELVEPRGRKTDAAVDGHIWDLRIVVAGGRVVGAARRLARSGEWRTNAALGAEVEPIDPPPIARALALAAARAARADLVGVDLLPAPNGGFIVLELNGAVDFRPVYAPQRDVFLDAVAALLEDGVRQPELAAASV